MDYFHHILFVGFGCIPSYVFYNSNLMRLVSFASCGLTGSIEYFTLALVKHNYLSSLKQKCINSYIYNYLRYPLSIYAMITIYLSYINNPETSGHPALLIYINLILFFNGSYYNKLTIENYAKHKMLKYKV